MSGQGGTWRFGASSIDPAFLATLQSTLAHRGADGGGCSVEGGTALSIRLLHPSPQHRDNTQPVRSPAGNLLTFDGRLDNRASLASVLRPARGGRSDAEVAAAAYDTWGLAALDRLIGDWALVVWDCRLHHVALARDYSGARPLYYELTSDRIIWSSELETFLQLQPGRRSLNDEYLTTFLIADPAPDSTPYAGVYAVPPGGCVTITRAGLQRHTHSELDPHVSIRYRKDTDYDEHFRELFRAAVKGRLEGCGPVWAELSGGLDSSSIVGMADDLVRAGEAPSASLQTISYVFDESPMEDERTHISLVEAQRGVPGRHVTEREFSPFIVDDSPFFSRPVPVPGRMRKTASEMAAQSARVLLSGSGGDAVMWSSTVPGAHIADLCRAFRWRELHRAIVQRCLSTSRSYLDVLWSDGLRLLAATDPVAVRPAIPAWLVASVSAREEGDRGPLLGDLSFSQRVSYRFVAGALKIPASQYHRTFGRIIPAFPFLDRRIVQFMLAVPFDQKLRDGVSRTLHRRAMTGIIPGPIAARRDKGGTQATVCRAVRRDWPRLEAIMGRDARVVRRGYVNASAVHTDLQHLRAGLHVDLYPIVRLLGLEVWLRQVETRYPSEVGAPRDLPPLARYESNATEGSGGLSVRVRV